jgi:acyl-coenzyme A thioesterase PaaI-like protein
LVYEDAMTPPFQPSDPDFARRVRASFVRQRVMTTIGAEMTQVAPGAVEIAMPYRADLAQQHGFLHAGVLTTMMAIRDRGNVRD